MVTYFMEENEMQKSYSLRENTTPDVSKMWRKMHEMLFDYCHFWSSSFLRFPLRCLRENKLERFQNMILVFGPIWSQRGQALQ